MAKQIIVGNRIFKTKKAAEEVIRFFLNQTPLNSVVSEPGHTFLVDLVSLHPDATDKIGVGVSHFSVENNAYAARGFRLHRIDGSSTDFSVYTCLDGKHNRKAQVHLALRTATMHQVSAFRDQQFFYGDVLCALTGAHLTREECHVDHESPSTFDVLAQAWMQQEHLTLDTVWISSSADNQQGREMTDLAQIASWRTFHQRFARLRIVSAKANLSDAKIQHNRKQAGAL